MSIKGISLLLLLVSLLTFPFKKQEREITEEGVFPPFVLIQLFTSQGCSSCPPADSLLSEVAEQYESDKVFVLSYHVDYWDRLCWKDPFSQKAFTEKQQDYAGYFHSRNIYTPQVVVNGQDEFVGSNRSEMRAQINKYKSVKAPASLSIESKSRDHNQWMVEYELDGMSEKELFVKMAVVANERTTQVKRGENSNRTLTNTHVVLQEIRQKISDSKGSITIGLIDGLLNHKNLKVIAYVQGESGPILAADQITWTE
ncbi:DUF1223 domain-containing protein [Croceiramulus getboli]|nr:DUF1223 domain-containing protein [Flavobacteriaceae bacterium YJPT1-3]